VAKILY